MRWELVLGSASVAACTLWLIVRRSRSSPPAHPNAAGFKKNARLQQSIKRVMVQRRVTSAEGAQTRGALLEVFHRHSQNGAMSKHGFIKACAQELQLNMSDAELTRVFVTTGSEAGTIDGDTFVQLVRQRFFLRSVSTLKTKTPFDIPSTLDLDKDTAANYDGGPGTPFQGPYKEVRASRDHDYHGRYTPARQKWQDGAIETIVQRTEPQPQPWLVFTCGGMGVGKGYALGWLSEQGIFPLEHIVHIDPDYFKSQLPEWDGYVAHAKSKGDASIAGNRCHRESCYLQELALEEALKRKQNCWVDGSLRNATWFTEVFKDIRERFPDYRVAIIAVRASTETVMQRVASRAAATGRSVPDKLVFESLEAVDQSVSILGPQADFVAEVRNEGSVPTLAKVTTIDRSGAWAALKQRFARTLPAAHEFPTSLAPIALRRVDAESITLEVVAAAKGERDACQAKLVATVGGGKPAVSHEVVLDPECPLNLSDCQRENANVPADVATSRRFRMKGTSHKEVGAVSLTFGGFAYHDKAGALVAVSALHPLRTDAKGSKKQDLIAFGPKEALSEQEAAAIPKSRWDQMLSVHRQYEKGARRVAWVMAFERLAGRMVATGGGFAYELETPSAGRHFVFFPLLSE